MVSLSTATTASTPLLCGSEKGGSAMSSSVRRVSRIEQVSDVIPEFLFSQRQPNVDGRDLSLAVDQKRSGERIQAAVQIADFLVAQHDPIIDLQILDIRFHRIPAVFVHGDAEHGEA